MSNINSNIVSGIDLYAADTNPTHLVGTLAWDLNVGKAFRYSLNGASALVKGNLLQEAVEDVQFEGSGSGMAVGTAGVVGDAFIQVTNGTTTVVPTQYVGGSISVATAGTVAIGDEYTITGIAGVLTTGGALKVYIDRPLRYAYTTSAKLQMKPSPWAGVIQQPATTQTGMTVGGVIYEIPASTATVFQYGWVQTHGVFTALSDGSTFAVGSELGNKSGTAGAATVLATATTRQSIGVSRTAAMTGLGIPMFLRID